MNPKEYVDRLLIARIVFIFNFTSDQGDAAGTLSPHSWYENNDTGETDRDDDAEDLPNDLNQWRIFWMIQPK